MCTVINPSQKSDSSSSSGSVLDAFVEKEFHKGSTGKENYLRRLKLIGPKVDPLARLGVFATQDSADAGAESLRSPTTAFGANPFYTTITGTKTDRAKPNPYLPQVG